MQTTESVSIFPVLLLFFFRLPFLLLLFSRPPSHPTSICGNNIYIYTSIDHGKERVFGASINDSYNENSLIFRPRVCREEKPQPRASRQIVFTKGKCRRVVSSDNITGKEEDEKIVYRRLTESKVDTVGKKKRKRNKYTSLWEVHYWLYSRSRKEPWKWWTANIGE